MAETIPSEFRDFVDSLIASRRFLSEQEVLAESLRLLQGRESLADQLRAGFQQIDEGQCVNGAAAIGSLRSRLQQDGNG